VTATCFALACGAAPGGNEDADAGPALYVTRSDSARSDPGLFQVDEEAGDVHVLTGPAGIAYRPADAVSDGPFRVEATFVEHGSPAGYPEGYGVFIGGRDLEGSDPQYTYLLVRSTGDFLVRRRRGRVPETLKDWTPEPAVRRPSAEVEDPRNVLAVEVAGNETTFLVNGIVVFQMATADAAPYGVAGLRINHRLDVRVSDWSLGSPR
jgi:hypothetical protein